MCAHITEQWAGNRRNTPTSVTHRATSLPRSAHGFNGTAARLHLVMAHNRDAKDFGPCWQRTASAFECILRGATGDGWWSAGRWFQTAGKASMIPHADDDEKWANRHLIRMYILCTVYITLKVMVPFIARYPSATEMVSAWTTFHC